MTARAQAHVWTPWYFLLPLVVGLAVLMLMDALGAV